MNKYSIYEPAEDSYLIKKHIKHYAKNQVLEIGTGSGILALEAAKYAKKVTAVDIQKEVIKHCKKTIKNDKITFKQSNLFQNIKQSFDLIIFNPPYLPDDPRIKDIALDGGKKGYELTEQFLNNANLHLKEDGKILLLFSSLTKQNKINEIIENNLLNYEQIDQLNLPFEILYVYIIEKSNLLKQLEKNKLTNPKKFSRGRRGLIYKAVYKNKEVIIKSKNPRSKALSTIEFEANWLKKLNKHKIGPKLLLKTKEFIVMEYIEGDLFTEYIENNKKLNILKLIKNIMNQLDTLDKLGINKQEMTHPYKHIIIRNHKPVLIDFERSKHTEKPRNITQFIQHLTSKNISSLLNNKNIILNKEKMQNLAKIYKNQRSKELYKEIIDAIK